MVPVDSLACWVADSLVNGAGFVAVLYAWDMARSPKFRRLLWLVPAILVCAWLESALGMGLAGHATEESSRLAALLWPMGRDILAWLALTLIVVGVRRAIALSRTKSASSGNPLVMGTEGNVDRELRGTVERFLAQADKGESGSIVATYDPEFSCVRVADAGGFVRLTHEQMAAFWNHHQGPVSATQADTSVPAQNSRPGGHVVPTKETAIHYAEIIGNLGFVLLTRIKDLGSGWEPMFYCLVWQKQGEEWRLLREYVHQRTVPRWR